MRNIFVEKSCTGYGGETIPTRFSKKSRLSISLDQQSKVLYSTYCILICGLSKYSETKLQTICFYLYKAFLKNKKGLKLVFLSHFLHDFWIKKFLLLYSINWPNFIVWLYLIRKILSIMCILFVNQVVTS